jgi:hypothetical protein
MKLNELGKAFSDLDEEINSLVNATMQFKPRNNKLELYARRLRQDMERMRVVYAVEMGADV